jgi:hypothetical protein
MPVRRGRCGGLLGEAEVEHLLREDLTDFQQYVFNLGESGSPSRALRAVEFLDKVFGDALDVGSQFFYLRSALFVSRHPWPLSQVGSK